jgi:hypothetical protein
MSRGRTAARCLLTAAALAPIFLQARCAAQDRDGFRHALRQPTRAKMGSTLDMPIAEIASSEDGCAILHKDFPGLREHPMYVYIRALSLNQIASMSRGRITRRMLDRAKYDLAAAQIRPAAAVAGDYAQACGPEPR